jgi:AAA+ ATPase superfamily predicted ATPase
MNPFVYGRVVSRNDFCPRPELEKQLKAHISANQNVLIEGERRTGKTSLICETIRKIKGSRVLYVDLLEIKTVDDLCRRMVKAIVSLGNSAGFLGTLMKSISNLRPVMSFDQLSGMPKISLGTEAPLEPNSMEAILDVIAKHNSGSKIVVVLDEFQDILNLTGHKETLAILRGKIQFQKNVPYVFSGSIRNKMNEIFNSPDSPFFKSAITIEVGSIDKNAFKEFIVKKFKGSNRGIDAAVIDKIFPIAQDNPGDIQQLCGALWDCSDENDFIAESHISKAFELIFSRETKGYESLLNQFSAQQFHCLTGLTRIGDIAPLSSEFMKITGISQPSSIKKALTRLVELNVIFKSTDEYKFVNPYFRAWLISKNI